MPVTAASSIEMPRHRAATVPVRATTGLLFGVMAAHAMLETARDALFLGKLGPHRLAWAYLAIAACALLALTAVRRLRGLRDPRRVLVAFLVAAATGTAILAATLGLSRSLIFVLYVWTGLVATLVVPCFWTLVDRSVPLHEAKRGFARIGAGGVFGALVGSAIAAVLGRLVAPGHLVTAGAAAFALVALAAIVIAPRANADDPVPRRAERAAASRRTHRYIRMLIALGILSTIALTLGDLVFKRVVAERVPAADLATVFGAIYTGLNGLGLAIQLVIAPRLLAQLGVGTALVILPLIVTAAALGFAATATLVSIAALKLGDGGLRHSLHRVTSEILFLPIPAALRDGAKPIADAIGQRGGQVVAVLIVLAAGVLGDGGAGARVLAALAGGAGLLWLGATVLARTAYVAEFREMLAAGEVQRDVRLPELDAQSVDLLTQALASPDELESLAALELLARERDRVPVLVLYHPRRAVVRGALRLLDRPLRPDIAAVLTHLLDHDDPEIRAEALAASSRTGGHRGRLVQALVDPFPQIRATAAVGLLDDRDHAATAAAVVTAMVVGAPGEQLALAHAIAYRPDERTHTWLAALLASDEPAVMHEVLAAYVRAPHLADLQRLLGLLHNPHVRGVVRSVFLATRERGLDLLVSALDDPATPVGVRQHVPRTLSRFRSRRAAAALVARLAHEPDGTTEYKILRALGRMRTDDPALALDAAALRRYLRRAVAQAARFARLHGRLRGAEPATAGGVLLRDLLLEKRRNAIEHAFRVLGILHPRANLRAVHDALLGTDAARRTAAREIVDAVVDSDTRAVLYAIVDELPPEARRARLDPLAPGPSPAHAELLAELVDDPSESLRCVAAFHIAELRLVGLRGALVRARPLAGSPLVMHAFDQAIARLDERP